jgi:hypothetical protein
VQPSPEGLGYRMEDDAERRSCGTLPLCYPNLILLVTGRSTSLANKINATESTIPLIWTALAESSPGRQSWVYIPTATSPARTAESQSCPN